MKTAALDLIIELACLILTRKRRAKWRRNLADRAKENGRMAAYRRHTERAEELEEEQ